MHKYSIVIPFRERHDHLSTLVPHLREHARLHSMQIEIIVAEQVDSNPLRRGALRNEGVRHASGDIIVLHDVDYLPDEKTIYWKNGADVFRAVERVEFVEMTGTARNDSDVPTGYRHFKKSVDTNFFGGVLCITREAFLKVNGYNPMFEGWGLEDDDFRERVYRNNLNVLSGQGLFKALPHPDSFRNDELFRKNQLLFAQREALASVGMSSAARRTFANPIKASRYGVDVWVDVTEWPLIQPTALPSFNIGNVDYGSFLLLDNVHNDHVQRKIASGQRWEPEIMELCERFVAHGSIAIDIGANIGTFTVRLAQLVGPSGLVLAFEPQRIIYQQLCGNVFINKLKNVYAQQVAIGKEETTVTLTPIDYDNGAPGEVRIHGTGGEVVNCLPLDSFGLQNVSLIKIDVERYEPFVFDGARETIKQNRPVILFELTTLPLPEYPPNFVVDLLVELNYNIYQVGEWGDFIGIPKERDA